MLSEPGQRKFDISMNWNAFCYHVGSWRGRQSIGHQVDADGGVACVGAGRRVLRAVHIAQQSVLRGVGS